MHIQLILDQFKSSWWRRQYKIKWLLIKHDNFILVRDTHFDEKIGKRHQQSSDYYDFRSLDVKIQLLSTKAVIAKFGQHYH